MFELMLMRHAKSDWHSHTADIDRPLNDRGMQDAKRMGAYLKLENIIPDKMIISSAQRTQQTAALLMENLAIAEKDVILDNELYLADAETMCDIIRLYADAEFSGQRLLILAHNPGMDYLVSYLASTLLALTDSGKLMTTCAVACFHMKSLDALNKQGQGELQCLIRPKEII